MSIDGIGGKGPLPPSAGAAEVAATQLGQSVEVAATQGPAAAGTEATAGSEALAQLERGEIGLPQYLDATVQQAVQHLQGQLSAEQLGFVQGELRRQLQSDPALMELVRRTTGQLPSGGDQ